MNWNSIDITPPDELVEVKNKKGYTTYAYPTYYPFKIQEGKRGEITPCEPYWSGSWMVECQDLTSDIGKIVAWRLPIE